MLAEFAPDGIDQPMPPWAQNLPQLGAIDTLQARPDDLAPADDTASTVPEQTDTPDTASTVPEQTDTPATTDGG